MERYCIWLRAQLAKIKDERGQKALWQCCGEVDFSNNSMGDQEVWMLLETLAQFQIHAAVLKLYKNRISQAGVLAICEFIRSNSDAGPVHELHLSQNEIDDDAALELLSTLHSLSTRYPPKRPDGRPVPVWVRLNRNAIRDSAKVLRDLHAEGISSCPAPSSQGCGPTRCARPDCPLLHLDLGEERSDPASDAEAGDRAKRSRGGRKRQRDRERRRGAGAACEDRSGEDSAPRL